MAVLNSIISFMNASVATGITAPGKMWHLLILNVFDFIADYGWRIVVFTILLKLVLSPLDFYQRYKMHKNQKITERLKPTMDKIQKQCGGDKQAFSQKQMELNRKEGYSYFSSCLPMIATMVVFITLWLSMNTVGQYMMLKEYATLYDEYNIAYDLAQSENKDESTSVEIGQDVVYKLYYDGIDDGYVQSLREKYGLSDEFSLEPSKKVQASFLWIKNIWAPDVPWGNKAIMDYDSFSKAVDKYSKHDKNGLDGDVLADLMSAPKYERVMGKLLSDSGQSRTNGYLILPVLVVLLSVGTQILSMIQQKRAGQVSATGGAATSMKVMMFVMPFIMATFAIQYASIFTLYMVTNSAVTLFLNMVSTSIIKLMDRSKKSRNYGIATGSTRVASGKKSPIIHYVKGANPNAGAREAVVAVQGAIEHETSAKMSGKDKKAQKQKADKDKPVVALKQSGRPDPNALLNADMSAERNKKKK